MTRILLAKWRRMVAELYATVRNVPYEKREAAWHLWRAGRDQLFWQHPLTPLNAAQKAAADEVAYFPYDPAWRKIGRIDRDTPHEQFVIELPEGDLRMTRIAYVHFDHDTQPHTLGLYWIEGYGGGLFLPFRDLTNGPQTYGGGRYLYDTIKGADLGQVGDDIILDFNFSYNPSCAYQSMWVCPLAPRENHLSISVEAGELKPAHYQ